jgi:four helix bundle protein
MKKENIIQEKSYLFALEIIGLVRRFPKNTEGLIIGKQLLRSATSIGANIEEAIGAFTKNDFSYKMSIALKEARETNYWLRLIRDSNILNNLDNFISKSEELRKILITIVKHSRNH